MRLEISVWLHWAQLEFTSPSQWGDQLLMIMLWFEPFLKITLSFPRWHTGAIWSESGVKYNHTLKWYLSIFVTNCHFLDHFCWKTSYVQIMAQYKQDQKGLFSPPTDSCTISFRIVQWGASEWSGLSIKRKTAWPLSHRTLVAGWYWNPFWHGSD